MIIEKASEQNTAELADTDILAADITSTQTASIFRVMVAMSVAGIFRADITKAGNSQVMSFNSGVNLVADCLYTFEHLVHASDSINYQYSVNATLRVLRVQEVVD
mgnify:CR=1 FL=1